MAETLDRAHVSVPTPRTETAPPPTSDDDWSQLTPELRRRSEIEQLQIDLAAGR